MKRGLLVFALLAGLTHASFASAAHDESSHGRWSRILSQLNLFAQQRKSIDAITAKTRAKMAPIRRAEKQKRAELSNLLLSDTPDRSAVKRKLHEIMRLRNERQQLWADTYFDVLNILHPDQRKTLAQFASKEMSQEHEHAH